MGMTITASLVYGFSFDELFKFPWYAEDEYHDEDKMKEWWFKVNNLKQPQGYAQERQLLEKYPMPIDIVEHCHVDSPMTIMTLPETQLVRFEAESGYPDIVESHQLEIDKNQKQILFDFCKKYGIFYVGNPEWWLVIYADC